MKIVCKEHEVEFDNKSDWMKHLREVHRKAQVKVEVEEEVQPEVKVEKKIRCPRCESDNQVKELIDDIRSRDGYICYACGYRYDIARGTGREVVT